MINKILVGSLLVVSMGCAFGSSLLHNTVSYADKVADDLAIISAKADRAVADGYMTPELRKSFAQTVMLPAISEDEKLVTFLKSWSPSSPIPPSFAQLNRLLLAGVNNFLAGIPDSVGKTELVLAINLGISDTNLWLSSLGKK